MGNGGGYQLRGREGMKLVHVVPHVDQEASGLSYSVPHLCESLAARGHEVELSCLAARGGIPGVRLDVHPQWPILGRFAVSSSHPRALRRKAGEVDIVHNHSLWSMVNVAAGWVVPGHRARLVTSPRGTLSRWALNRRRVAKRVLWPLQCRALTQASLLHATCQAEYEEIRALGLRAPVAVIPNGIDLPFMPANTCVSRWRTLLFLGRIHPKKGIDRLLRAWETLQVRHPSWRLVIVGVGEQAHEREAKELAVALGLERVEFEGARYGAEKSSAYFDAELFVLPTHSENFGMTVAEALAHGCPAVVSRGAPWSDLESEGCGWWVDHAVPNLMAALDTAMSLPSARLSDMGLRGRAWMERDFGWDPVAQKMEAAYRWITAGGDVPAWVQRD